MHICMVTSAPFPPREGVGFYVWNLARFLASSGNQVQIITRGRPTVTYCRSIDGIAIWQVTFLPLYPFHVHLHSLFVNRLLQELESQMDLLHLHSPLVMRPKTTLPCLVTVHTPMKADVGSLRPDNPLSILAKLQSPVSFQIEMGLFSSAGSITAVANSVALELSSYGLDSRQVTVLANGVDTRTFSPNGPSNPGRRPYCLTVGRLGPRKGLEDLLHCARLLGDQFPDLQFLIAGSGPLGGQLRAAIRKYGLHGRVKLLGHISHRAQLAGLYRGAIACIHPAHYEGLPTVLLEAMACGRPVVATAVGGALDVIEDGYNGLLVLPKAPQAIAAAVARIVRNPGLAARLGRAARRTVEERYSWEVVGRRYLEEYQKLLLGARR
jgi:glycosyltransferase involved in cell wall biosynthesis